MVLLFAVCCFHANVQCLMWWGVIVFPHVSIYLQPIIEPVTYRTSIRMKLAPKLTFTAAPLVIDPDFHDSPNEPIVPVFVANPSCCRCVYRAGRIAFGGNLWTRITQRYVIAYPPPPCAFGTRSNAIKLYRGACLVNDASGIEALDEYVCLSPP